VQADMNDKVGITEARQGDCQSENMRVPFWSISAAAALTAALAAAFWVNAA